MDGAVDRAFVYETLGLIPIPGEAARIVLLDFASGFTKDERPLRTVREGDLTSAADRRVSSCDRNTSPTVIASPCEASIDIGNPMWYQDTAQMAGEAQP